MFIKTKKVKERIDEFINYFLIISNDDEEILIDRINSLRSNKELEKLWKDMKPLFDVMPTLANNFYFMWSTRFVTE